MSVMRGFAFSVMARVMNDSFDEDLYYRLCHIRWHENRTYDPSVSGKVDTERFIHLAILTGNNNVYKRLVHRRPSNAVLSSHFIFMDAQDYRLKVTDQDIYTIIRYGSYDIYNDLGLCETLEVRSILSMCKFKRRSKCGVCCPRPTLMQVIQEKQDHLDMLKSLLA